MMVRKNAKKLIQEWLDQSSLDAFLKSMLKMGLLKVEDDSPLLTITGDVLAAIERHDYEDARRILYKTVDVLISYLDPHASKPAPVSDLEPAPVFELEPANGTFDQGT